MGVKSTRVLGIYVQSMGMQVMLNCLIHFWLHVTWKLIKTFGYSTYFDVDIIKITLMWRILQLQDTFDEKDLALGGLINY